MKNHSSLLLLVPVLTATSAAWAAPAVTDGETPSTVVARPAEPAAATAADPNMDHGFLQPTALTQPAHTLTYNNYELLMHGLTYGITDDVQTSVTVMAPLTKDMPLVGVASAKWQFLQTARLHLAVQGSATMLHVFGSSDPAPGVDTGNNSVSVYFVGAGPQASYCLREDCSSVVSANASYDVGFANGGNGTLHAIVYGGSIVHGISRHVKLIGEVTSATAKLPDRSFDNAPGVLASYGVRLYNSRIASNIGFVRPIGSDGSPDFVLGLPFVDVAYRW